MIEDEQAFSWCSQSDTSIRASSEPEQMPGRPLLNFSHGGGGWSPNDLRTEGGKARVLIVADNPLPAESLLHSEYQVWAVQPASVMKKLEGMEQLPDVLLLDSSIADIRSLHFCPNPRSLPCKVQGQACIAKSELASGPWPSQLQPVHIRGHYNQLCSPASVHGLASSFQTSGTSITCGGLKGQAMKTVINPNADGGHGANMEGNATTCGGQGRRNYSSPKEVAGVPPVSGTVGKVLCRLLRQRYSQGQLPVIALLGQEACHTTDVDSWLAAGATDFVRKPICEVELGARIHLQVSLARAMRSEVEWPLQVLYDVLPRHVVRSMRVGAKIVTEPHDEVTVLFTDIEHFTELSASMPMDSIIMLLSQLFSAFDVLCEKHGVYKVETIGDAYMCVAGHDGDERHAERLMRVAVDMLGAAQGLACCNILPIRIRIGMHTGPAHSGVLSPKCPRYCFFGDTINTASRMESHGFPMCVHVSSTTHARLQGSSEWGFLELGVQHIKGKGPMKTYLAKVGEYLEALRSMPAKQPLPPWVVAWAPPTDPAPLATGLLTPCTSSPPPTPPDTPPGSPHPASTAPMPCMPPRECRPAAFSRPDMSTAIRSTTATVSSPQSRYLAAGNWHPDLWTMFKAVSVGRAPDPSSCVAAAGSAHLVCDGPVQ